MLHRRLQLRKYVFKQNTSSQTYFGMNPTSAHSLPITPYLRKIVMRSTTCTQAGVPTRAHASRCSARDAVHLHVKTPWPPQVRTEVARTRGSSAASASKWAATATGTGGRTAPGRSRGRWTRHRRRRTPVRRRRRSALLRGRRRWVPRATCRLSQRTRVPLCCSRM